MLSGDRSKFAAFGLVVLGAALIVFSAVWVMQFTYSVHDDYKAEREQTAEAKSNEGEETTRCIDFAEPKALVDCVREEEATKYKSERDYADLHAQQDMATFALGLLWFGALGFVTGAGSLVALIWTFREQRKLTQNQSCAYLRIGWGQILLDPTYGLTYRLWLTNTGETPARNIRCDLILLITSSERAGQERERIERPIGPDMDELPSEATDYCQDRDGDILSLPIGLFEDQGSHYRKTGYPIGGEEDSVHDVGEDYVSVSGTIAYDDVFGRRHKMRLSQYSYSLKDDGHLRGSGFSEPDPHDQKFRK